MPSNSTSFKRILEFHELTLGKSDEEKQLIAQSQSIDFSEYQQRIIGKEKKMEFFIFMNAVASFDSIDPIDEELSQISGEKTPDYEVLFTDGYKMMIEVKHTDKDEFKISGGNLKKRIDYAAAHDMPLRFAISIKGYWGLFTSNFLESKAGRITISDYVDEERNSWFDRELETCSYMFLKPLKIISVYSNNTTNGLRVSFEPYGELISYEFYYDNRMIFRVDSSDISKRLHMFVLETVEDRLSNISQDITTDGDITTIVESNDNSECQTFAEYLFVLAIIRHVRYEHINSKDNIFLTAKKDDSNIVPVEYIRLVMADLSDDGVEIVCVRDGDGYRFDDYRKKFWTKKAR